MASEISPGLGGLIAATYTPMHADAGLNLDAIGPMVGHLIRNGVTGLYVCGSTGEGVSLTGDERRAVTRAYIEASAGRLPVVVQVGHNSLAEARSLAADARDAGAAAISATCPSYFRVGSVTGLVDCMAEIAAGAPELPFYYYHIPTLTGAALDMVEFLRLAPERIPNLAGLKYTATTLHEYLECLEFDGGRFEVLWGCDEMLLGALAVGCRAAIGSTYNVAAPLYQGLIDAFERGDLDAARAAQSRSVRMIREIGRSPFHPAMKAVLGMLGVECGPCRLPMPRLRDGEVADLHGRLESIGFFEWATAGFVEARFGEG